MDGMACDILLLWSQLATNKIPIQFGVLFPEQIVFDSIMLLNQGIRKY